MASIFIATPCYGDQMLRGYVISLMKSRVQLTKLGHQVHLAAFGNESLITRARNNLAGEFMGSGYDILMFIDADITWQPQALLALLDSPHEVCGIPYPTKSYNWKKIADFVNASKAEAGKVTTEQLHDIARIYTINQSKGKSHADLPAGWKRVDSLGTGFLMIRRPALERMYEHYRESLNYVNDVKHYLDTVKPEHCVAVFDTMIEPGTRRYLSEDYAFCRRWRDIGGEIFAHLKHRLVHTGTASF